MIKFFFLPLSPLYYRISLYFLLLKGLCMFHSSFTGREELNVTITQSNTDASRKSSRKILAFCNSLFKRQFLHLSFSRSLSPSHYSGFILSVSSGARITG